MIDSNTAKRCVVQNILHTKTGVYKSLPIVHQQRAMYYGNYLIPPMTEICNVCVMNVHPITVAYQFCLNNKNPVVAHYVSDQFDGSNLEISENMRDILINIRTDFSRVVNSQMYPISSGDICYNKYVYIIRDDALSFLHPSKVGRISLITVSCPSKLKLVENMYSINDFMNMSKTIEAIFQTAHSAHHDTLIISDIGCSRSDNHPVGDIISLFNAAIFKYGHLFKFIIFAINAYDTYSMSVYQTFASNIIKPQDITSETNEENQQIINNNQ